MRIPSINWLKVAEALAPLSPVGPFFGPDGEIYGADGAVLVAPAPAADQVPSPVSGFGPTRPRSRGAAQAAGVAV